jgi:hypothetical protein
MKKVKMDISPLDDAIADIEAALQSIDTYVKLPEADAALDARLFEDMDVSRLHSNTEIKAELASLSTLMSELQALLQQELTKIEASQAGQIWHVEEQTEVHTPTDDAQDELDLALVASIVDEATRARKRALIATEKNDKKSDDET